jgi:fluoride exporter
MLILSVALGGALGAVLRYGLVAWSMELFGRDFPYGTLLVNILGSFAIGVLYLWFQNRTADHEMLRAILIIGVLGGFTTFSAFSIETLNLALGGQLLRAMLNIVLNVTLCLVAALVGMKLFKTLFT